MRSYLFFSIQHAAAFQGRAQRVPVLRVHRHERQAVFLLDEFHHRQRGLDRRRIGLDEQILEQRIIFLVQPRSPSAALPRANAFTICETSRGMTLDATLMTPLAPTAMNGSVSESSPDRISNFGPSAARNCDTRSQLPPASLMPTMFLQSAREPLDRVHADLNAATARNAVEHDGQLRRLARWP